MRKRQAKKRPLLPDPKFNDQLVTRFVNMLMWDGKKSIAFNIFYDAMDIVDERKQDDEKTPLEIWKEALSNVMKDANVREGTREMARRALLQWSGPEVSANLILVPPSHGFHRGRN